MSTAKNLSPPQHPRATPKHVIGRQVPTPPALSAKDFLPSQSTRSKARQRSPRTVKKGSPVSREAKVAASPQKSRKAVASPRGRGQKSRKAPPAAPRGSGQTSRKAVAATSGQVARVQNTQKVPRSARNSDEWLARGYTDVALHEIDRRYCVARTENEKKQLREVGKVLVKSCEIIRTFDCAKHDVIELLNETEMATKKRGAPDTVRNQLKPMEHEARALRQVEQRLRHSIFTYVQVPTPTNMSKMLRTSATLKTSQNSVQAYMPDLERIRGLQRKHTFAKPTARGRGRDSDTDE